MIHKKQSLVVKTRRSISEFFNRSQEVFERKFDGFPAVVEGPSRSVATDVVGTAPPLDISGYLTEDAPPCPDVDPGGCGDSDDCFTNGGLLAGWAGSDGDTWTKVSGGTLDASAVTGNRIDNVVRLIDVNTLWWGGKAYLTEASPTTQTEYLLEFIIDPMAPDDNPSSDNQLRVMMAGTLAEAQSSTSMGRSAAFWWNRQGFSPSSGYNIGAGNTGFVFAEGVRYSFRWKHDDTTGSIEYKFWLTSDGEPASWSSTTSEGGTGRIGRTAIRLDAIQWETGTTPDPVNGVAFWLGRGPSAVSPPLNCASGDCGGQSALSVLSESGGSYSADVEVDYYTEVWYDGLMAAKGIDYDVVDNAVVPKTALDPDVIVRARYVIR